MSKKPVPKKKRAKRATRLQHSHYMSTEIKRLTDKQQSPYGMLAEPKSKADKMLKGITRVKA